MTEVIYISDHVARAERELLTKFSDKPRIKALVDALIGPVQQLEDDFHEITMWTSIAISSGDQLDQWGAIVGEQRGGVSDSVYRRFIFARALANVCEGTTNEIINVWKMATDAPEVLYSANYPAAYSLTAFTNTPLSDSLRRRIRLMMDDVKPAGVGHKLFIAIGGVFTYDIGPGYDLAPYAEVL